MDKTLMTPQQQKDHFERAGADGEATMTETPGATPAEAEPVPPRESVFERTADYVSAAMGRPTNIVVWLVLVIAWTAMGPYLARHPFLPAWSVSTGWNFPLNLITTVAELFIGFLVAAASNRSERNLNATLAAIQASEDRDAATEAKLTAALDANTALTAEVHKLTEAVHAIIVPKEATP